LSFNRANLNLIDALPETAPFQGKRLSADEVLRLYAARERNFRGTILRGCNFRGADLSGADFTRADIRSTRFINSKLRATKFCCVKTGLQLSSSLFKVVLIIVFAFLAGCFQGFFGSVTGYNLISSPTNSLGTLIGLFPITVVFSVIFERGFNIQAWERVTYTFPVFLIISTVLAILNTTKFAESSAFAIPVAFTVVETFTTTIAGSIALASALVIAVVGTFTINGALTISLGVSFGTATLIGVIVSNGYLGFSAMIGSMISAIVSSLFAISISTFLRRSNSKFWNLRFISIIFSAIGGTRFDGADLTGETFAKSNLNDSSFANSRQCQTVLDYVCWHNVKNLDHSHLGNSNIQDFRVRNLLVTLNGVGKDLSGVNLYAVNLSASKLEEVDLEGAYLSNACLQAAQLNGANLTGAQCVGTDFTGACLTGACLEAWNIDETTILKDIDCRRC
jgi:uncharacterized protein YjbI with pentapeptide repeats